MQALLRAGARWRGAATSGGHFGADTSRESLCFTGGAGRGLPGIRISKLFHEKWLRPALTDGPGGGWIIRLRLVSLGSGSPNHDGVSELKGRGYVPQSLYCLAGASNGERTEAKDPTEN